MKNIIKGFLRILFFPLLLMVFVLKYTSAVRKGKKYIYDKENSGTFEERSIKVARLINLYLFLKGIRIVPSFESDLIKNKPLFFIANHKSNFDPLIIASVMNQQHKENEGVLQTTFVSKIELKNKSYGKIASYIDCSFIDRSNVRQAFECFNEQAELIKKNISICIFPEGTRVAGNDFGEFKPGSIKVALKNFVPIFPVAIYGTDRLDKKSFFCIRFRKVYVRFGTPIDTFQYADANSEFVMNNLKNKISIMYNDLQKRKKH